MRRGIVSLMALAAAGLVAPLLPSAAAEEAVAAASTEIPVTATIEPATAVPASSAASAAAPSDIFTPEERAALSATTEQFAFQAEVSRMMDIIIHSLYTHRDVFLRELLSNAIDALDKARFVALTEAEDKGDGEDAAAAAERGLSVRVSFDKAARTLTIADTGIGMTRDELAAHLGVVARSGTTAFLDAANKAKDKGKDAALSLIGQFGVGFYSAYLVADKVTVVSKSDASPEQWVWESAAGQGYTLAKDPRGPTLGRGTQITLHLKDDAAEYLSLPKIKSLAARYSRFAAFPVLVADAAAVAAEAEAAAAQAAADAEAAAAKAAKTTTNEDGVDVTEDAEEAPAKPAAAKEAKPAWEQVNGVRPVWTRAPASVTADEYAAFFRALTKTKDTSAAPLETVHFAAEGESAFSALLFVPKTAAAGLYDRYYEKNTNVRLYVRRVLVSRDAIGALLPRWLNFAEGVVDADDLPLHVNRETLAESGALRAIGKRVTRKVLDAVKKMAEAEAEDDDDDDDDDEDEDGDDAAKAAKAEKSAEAKAAAKAKKAAYATFYSQFGRSLKLGYLDDHAHRAAIAPLLRFRSTHHVDQEAKADGEEGKAAAKAAMTSLDAYVARMPAGQKTIYFVTGESEAACLASPFVEAARAKGIEVLLLGEPLDEYLVQALTTHDGTPLRSLARDGTSLAAGDDEKKEERARKRAEKKLQPLLSYLTTTFAGAGVEKVTVSSRLASSPMVLVASQWGASANMQRILRAQALGDAAAGKNGAAAGGRVLEINPRHATVRALLAKVEAAPDAAETRDLAFLLLDAATLRSGFAVDDAEKFAARVHAVVAGALDVAPDAAPAAEDEDAGEDDGEEVVDADAGAGAGAGGENVIKLDSSSVKIESVTATPAEEAEDKDEL